MTKLPWLGCLALGMFASANCGPSSGGGGRGGSAPTGGTAAAGQRNPLLKAIADSVLH